MSANESTLKLPDGYTIEPHEHSGDETLLVLKRADGSPVAAFEFSALGPGPKKIWELAWDNFDASEASSQDRHRQHEHREY